MNGRPSALKAALAISSWATHVAKLTGRVDVVEMALNHQSGVLCGVAGTYIRETFLEERERAMQAWADHLLS